MTISLDFWQVVLATAVGVLVAALCFLAVVLTIVALVDLFFLAIQFIHRCGTAIMNKITGMDTYTRRSEREKERDDWWKDA